MGRKAAMNNIPKGYKQTEVGVIPEDWEVTSLGELFTFSGGLSASRDQLSNDGYCYLHYGDIHGANKTFIDVKKDYPEIPKLNVTIRNVSPKSLLNEGDVVFVDASEDDAGASKHIVVFNPEGIPFISGLHTIVSKSKNDIVDNGYKRYCFQPSYVKSQFKFYAVGTKVTGISKTNIAKILIPLPPTKAEQIAIAATLSDADAFISSLEKLIVKKRNIKQGAMQELLTGKKRLSGFNGEWAMKKLGEIAHIDPENIGSDTSADYAFKYISLEDVDYGTLRGHTEQVFCTAPSRARRKVRKGDVLVSTVRPNLKSHLLIRDEVVDTVCSTGFSVVRYKPTLADPSFIFAHMFAGGIERQIEALLTGSNYPAINGSDVKALRIPCPMLPEQTAIAQILSDMDAEIEQLEEKLAKYRQIKQGMMQELLTGKTRLI